MGRRGLLKEYQWERWRVGERDDEITGRKVGTGFGFGGDANGRLCPQQQQINNQANIGQHAAAAAAKGGGDEKVKANDKAYNAALKNLPDKQYDPWRGVR